VDTCDQQWNPACVPGSLNYALTTSGCSSDALCTARANRCAQNGPSYCSPFNWWCCSVQKVPCTKEAEIVAVYDGSIPSFNLVDETNPSGGIIINYLGAPTYSADNDGSTDPSTGLPPQRTLSLQILCDPAALVPTTPFYFQSSTCQFTVYLSSMYACGQLYRNASEVEAACQASTAAAEAACQASTAAFEAACQSNASAAATAYSAASSAAEAAASVKYTEYGAGGFVGGAAAGALGMLILSYLRLQCAGRGDDIEEVDSASLLSTPKF
jgi:hypothetical protein